MDADIVNRMRAEEADLSRKLKAVRDFLAAYGAAPVSSIPTAEEAPVSPKERPTGTRPKVGIEGFGDYGRTIIAECMRSMLSVRYPLKTRQLVEHLEGAGIEITGENKINAVGALLSRSDDITSHGKSGWTVADAQTALTIVGRYGRPIKATADSEAMLGDGTRNENGKHENDEEIRKRLFAEPETEEADAPTSASSRINPFAVRAG